MIHEAAFNEVLNAFAVVGINLVTLFVESGEPLRLCFL